jgi:adenylate cyclase class 2
MPREIELKLLGVDPEEIGERLRAIGAKMLGSELQRIFTYDFPPYWSMVPGLAQILSRNFSEQSAMREAALKRMGELLVDLEDLLDNNTKETIIGGVPELRAKGLTAGWQASIAEGNDREFLDRLVEATRDLGVNPNKWVRLRSRNGGATLAVKQIFGRRVLATHREHDVAAVEEVEVEVADFDGGKALLAALGYFPKNYQEKRRTRYAYHERVLVDVDEWPLIPAYAEIEAPTVEEIFEVGRLIGAKAEDFCSMNADDVFTHYGLNMYHYKELKF